MQNLGTVLWFNEAKGYGEILADNGTKFFFNYSCIKTRTKYKTIDCNIRVQFTNSDQHVFNLPLAYEVKPILAHLELKLKRKIQASKTEAEINV